MVTPYTDVEIKALRNGEHAEIIANCPTCKWLVTVERLQAEIGRLHLAIATARARYPKDVFPLPDAELVQVRDELRVCLHKSEQYGIETKARLRDANAELERVRAERDKMERLLRDLTCDRLRRLADDLLDAIEKYQAAEAAGGT